MLHVLLPVHDTVEPVSTVTVHLLPPPHVTVLFVPVERLQVLVPSHVELQLEVQVPVHVDWPLHDVVHPVPHVESQEFFDWQLYVTLLGRAPPSPAPPSEPPPNVQLPPVLQVHVLPEQVQSPVQPADPATPGLSLLPQPADIATATASALSTPTTSEEPVPDMGHLRTP